MTLAYTLDIDGLKNNPVPYKRTTQRAKFASANYRRYAEWKAFLQMKFRQQNGRAANLKGRYFVEVVAIYKDRTHGDTDNVAKGVNDALFADDKYVSGSYDFQYGKSGGLKVRIYELGGELAKKELGV